MTYRVAVIQNETELLRYSYADIRQLLTRQQYDWSYYTAENIHHLQSTLHRYHAVIVATNACNDRRILGWLTDNAQSIINHLTTSGAGLLVGFQMALSDKRGEGKPFPFLISPYEISGRYRFRDGELAEHGKLAAGPSFASSTIANLPNRIDLDRLTDECKTNTNVPGLYWGFLTGFTDDAYATLIEDPTPSPSRPLLVVSHTGAPRIVLSALVIDWQRHDQLWENLVRFVVEGDKPIAIVGKKQSASFDLDLLRNSLRHKRIPQHFVSLNALPEWNYDEPIFSSLVLDPSWTREEVTAFLKQRLLDTRPLPDIHYFERPAGTLLAACAIPAVSDYDNIVAGAIAWLQSQWHGELWEGSFWATFDVLDLMRLAGASLTTYRRPILDAIYGHIQPNGSYDDVPGATCAALQVFQWLNETSTSVDTAWKWLLDELPHQNIYNSATVLETFAHLPGVSMDPTLQREIIARIAGTADQWAHGLETLRYMRTLIAVGEYDLACRQIHKLKPATVGRDEWLTIFGAAETVVILLELYQNLDQVPDELERLLFSGIEYLLEEYDAAAGTWRHSAVATAKAAKAVMHFAQLTRPGVSEAIRSVSQSRQTTLLASALQELQARNEQLNTELISASEARAQTRQQYLLEGNSKRRVQNLAMTLVITTYVLAWMFIAAVVGARDSLDDVIDVIAQWREVSIPALIVVSLLPLFILVRMLAAFNRDPRWVAFSRKTLPFGKWVFGAE